jgi:prepilin-type N-terminal cleavage/methylation domain-containing protein
MNARRHAFTLIELLVVISIIALLILIFVPQIPAIVTWYRVHLSKLLMKQLETGVEQYHQVYRYYPGESLALDGRGRLKEVGWHESGGFYSLYLALQGPDGAGWGPTEDEPGIKEFPPVLESPGFADVDRINPRWSPNAWGKPDQYGMRTRSLFVDPFGRQVMYYQAHLDSKHPDISSSPYATQLRYNYAANRGAWQDGMEQRGADEVTFGGNFYFIYNAYPIHWRKRLTVSRKDDTCYPYNPTTYVIWMAGADEKFGYWYWSQEHSGFVVDHDPDSASDGVGICDDILNVGS